MAIYSFEGPQGSGKTTAGTGLAYEEMLREGRKIISNIHLTIPYTHFTLEYFLDNIATGEMSNCVLLLDEAYQYMDPRISTSKINRLFTYFVVQCRKRDVDMFVCTHHVENIDVRVRRALDLRGACVTIPEYPCKQCKGVGKINGEDLCPRCLGFIYPGSSPPTTYVAITRVHFLRTRPRRSQQRRFTIELAPSNKYWHLFDTKERVPMQAKFLQNIDTTEVV